MSFFLKKRVCHWEICETFFLLPKIWRCSQFFFKCIQVHVCFCADFFCEIRILRFFTCDAQWKKKHVYYNQPIRASVNVLFSFLSLSLCKIETNFFFPFDNRDTQDSIVFFNGNLSCPLPQQSIHKQDITRKKKEKKTCVWHSDNYTQVILNNIMLY